MRKSYVLSAGLAIALFSIFKWVGGDKENVPVSVKTSGVIDCAPALAASSVASVKFSQPATPFAVMIRKNVYSLSTAEINSIKTGITNMKALPYTNPTSWLYQAAIHGTTLTDALPSWNSCHKSGAEFFFLAWHRMYCYFFERILRAKSGDPNLTLPYWNYELNPVIPPAYRNSAAGNPLYDGSRYASMNSGGSLPASIGTAIDNALLDLPFYDFQGDINGPHGSVHVSIGGNMVSVSTAAKDPVFWLHHCNIDRLWEEWLGKCGGRTNPVDAAFLNKSYTFFDETGTAVSMTGSQVVSTATQLNYKYDDSKYCLKILPWKWYIYKRWPLIIWDRPIEINTKLLKHSLREAKPETLDNFIKQRNKSQFNFADEQAPDKLMIEIDKVQVDKLPEGVVEVYLNLPPNETPSPRSKSFVGLLDLFSVTHAKGHAGMSGMGSEAKIELNASMAARALKLSIGDLKGSEISFFVRGNTVQGKEITTSTNIKFGRMNMAIDIPEK